MKVVVTEADMHDTHAAKRLLVMIAGLFPRLRKIWADQGYQGNLLDWVKRYCRLDLEIVYRPPDSKGFVLLPRRWVVERTWAWLGNCRRLSKDYEFEPHSSETMIYVAMTRLMIRRLAAKG